MKATATPARARARAVGPAAAVPCYLVVPAHNERSTVTRCLDSVGRAALPEGFVWRRWVVLDDGSSDGTPEAVRDWAASGVRHVEVWTAPQRSGKSANLARHHRNVLSIASPRAVVVALDADVAVEDGALRALLAPFARDHRLSLTSGISRPDRHDWGRWASCFQMDLGVAIARRVGAGACRIDGRIFAYRAADLATFEWRAGRIAEDTQITAYALREGLGCRTVFDAAVRATPAASHVDFYRQTYRGLAATSAEPAVDRLGGARRREWVPAAAGVAARHPLRACAYVVARVAVAARHRVRPTTFTDWYAPVSSTKS